MTDLFMGSIMVTFIQFTLIYLIINYEWSTGINHAPKTFLIIIPRFISSLMMHLQVEPDIRNGLSLMKYAVNHPGKFKDYNDQGVSKILAPFFMGFIQALIAFVIEMLVIIHLSGQTQFLSIIISFASLAAIVTFDDRYANALYEHKINDAKGKIIKKSFFRSMIWRQEEVVKEGDVVVSTVLENPRAGNGKKCLKVLRFIQKMMRMYYVSINYYFLPYIILFMSFVKTK